MMVNQGAPPKIRYYHTNVAEIGEAEHPVDPMNWLATVNANIANLRLSDNEFRQFIANSITLFNLGDKQMLNMKQLCQCGSCKGVFLDDDIITDLGGPTEVTCPICGINDMDFKFRIHK